MNPAPLQRVQILVAYDGTPFDGWQSQRSGNAVQDHLEKAATKIVGQKTAVHGSGRTDAGVHALAQSAHVDLPLHSVPLEQWALALNAHLPWEIRVRELRPKPETFHARFSAKSKAYRYRIFNADWMNPLELKRAWHVPKHLDLELMRAAAAMLVGRHDFRAFCANRGWKETSTVREIWKISLRKNGPLITLDFSGEGFLYKMVRMLTANIVRVGQGKSTLAELQGFLHDPDSPKSTLSAPAEGLYLMKVGY
jgi:tRNA pseudouridine38-40 synthase